MHNLLIFALLFCAYLFPKLYKLYKKSDKVIAEEQLPPTRLPVWKTAASSYRALWNRQIPLMPFIWPVLAIGFINMWFGAHLLGPNESFHSARIEELSQNHLYKFLYPIAILDVLFFSSLLVSWLRYVVRGEWPLGVYVKLAFWKFFGLIISLNIFGFMVYIFMIFIASIQARISLGLNVDNNQVDEYLRQSKILPHLSTHAFCQFITMILVVFMFLNYYIKLAGTAVGDHLMGWRRSRQLVKGNKLRLIAANILILIPYFVFSELKSYNTLNGSFSVFLDILDTIFLIYQTVAIATLMGITYRTLVGTNLHPSQSSAEQEG